MLTQNYAYNDNQASTLAPQETPKLESASSELYNMLNSQASIIYRIQQKLHLLLDRKMPQQESIGEGKNPTSKPDLFTQLNQHIQKLQTNINDLEQIEKHLSEII